jgi:hypothetical protein
MSCSFVQEGLRVRIAVPEGVLGSFLIVENEGDGELAVDGGELVQRVQQWTDRMQYGEGEKEGKDDARSVGPTVHRRCVCAISHEVSRRQVLLVFVRHC